MSPCSRACGASGARGSSMTSAHRSSETHIVLVAPRLAPRRRGVRLPRRVSTVRLVERLTPEAARFVTPTFALREDMDALERVHAGGATAATVLYGGRILAALAESAVSAVGIQPSTSVLADLAALGELDLVGRSTAYWAHGLRRLGNDARHLRRRLASEDADLAVLFVERVLEWFFVRFADGPRLDRLTHDGAPLWQGLSADLRAVMDDLDRPTCDPVPLARALIGDDTLLKRSPAIAAVVAEMVLDRREPAGADALLSAALAHFPSDQRLLQLVALRCSRTGALEDALTILRRIGGHGAQDEETLGILGGVYKRLWERDPDDRAQLARAQRVYRDGWERSAHSNAYLGVNAATLVLWLGHPDEARDLARVVRRAIQDRWRLLERSVVDPAAILGYW